MKGHYTAVIEEDEYRVEELYDADQDIEYIVDIGANIGTASMQFQRFYPNAKILVCEPEPELLKYAKLNTENKLIYVDEAIIGDDRKEVTFNVCKWAGNGHVDGNFRWDLFKPMGSELDHQIKVSAATLKEIMDKYGFPRIDLLKIDTEGMEGQILQSFKPYMHLVKHFRGEWHGDKEIPLIKDALKDTHDFFFNRKLSTHGDIFATRKDFTPTETQHDGFKIIHKVGLPDRIVK
ncbi:FkbM family methyltransferase [Candidatus Dojkabacteria bacterium]|nr:FkbM family methyltransferase [Candidatus Dojkabacteria bacterium]